MTTANDPQVTLESPEAMRDEDLHPRVGAYFPRRYLTDFFELLQSQPDVFEVITYADLPWDDDCDYKRNYPAEWRNWQNQLTCGDRDSNKIYILLQYDVDSRPERTMGLLLEPAHAGIPANIMIFNRRVDRRQLRNTGDVALTDYELDIELLKRLERQGFVVGYHTNAYERACFNKDKALEIFDADVKELSRHFSIRYFSAHGGVPDENGRNNRDLPFHSDWVGKLKWVHNGAAIRVDGHFSDGGHNSMKRDPRNRDLRAFVAKLRPGGRYSILLHPQYYAEKPGVSPRYVGTPWYDELMAANRTSKRSFWEGVRLSGKNSSWPNGRLTSPIRAARAYLASWSRPGKK